MKTIQVRVSDEDKKAVEEIIFAMGLDMPAAIRLYLKKIIQMRAIPFPITAEEKKENSKKVSDSKK